MIDVEKLSVAKWSHEKLFALANQDVLKLLPLTRWNDESEYGISLWEGPILRMNYSVFCSLPTCPRNRGKTSIEVLTN